MFPILLILMVIAFFYAIARAKRREAGWQKLCRRYNLQFEGSWFSFFSTPIKISPYWEFFQLFSKGHSRKVIYRGRGQYRGYSIEVFDYQYTTGSGRSRQTHYFTPLLVHTRSQLGKIIIRPEGFLDKLAAVIGFDDIDLDYREFNKKFYVKSPDKKYAYDLLHSRAMEFLLRHSGITVETGRRSFLFYFDGKMSLREVSVFLDMGIDFAELLPGFLKTKIL